MVYVYDDKIAGNAALLQGSIKAELTGTEIRDRIHKALGHIGLNISLTYKEEPLADNTKTYAIDKEVLDKIYRGKLSMHEKILAVFKHWLIN